MLVRLLVLLLLLMPMMGCGSLHDDLTVEVCERELLESHRVADVDIDIEEEESYGTTTTQSQCQSTRVKQRARLELLVS